MRAVLLSVLLTISATTLANGSDLERRAAEQERQIIQLELQNARLRDEIELLHQKLLAYEKTREEEAPPASSRSEVVPATTPANAADEGPVHLVRAGESLSKIARQHGTTTEALVTLNGIRNPALIREGQRLRIPAAAEPAEDRAGDTADGGMVTGSHRVKPGETLYSIARSYGLSVEALTTANPGINAKALQVGQELKLSARKVETAAPPESSEPEAAPSSGRVADPGSSMGSSGRPSSLSPPLDQSISFGEFARLHRMDPDRLNALNGLDLGPKTVLASGTRLYVSAQPLE